MNQVAILFSLVVAALLQAALPTSVWTGWAPAPLLAGVVVYFSLVRSRVHLMEVALLAGLVEDSLSQVPLGTTSFAYAVSSLAIERWRASLAVRHWTTHAAVAAAVNAATTAFAFLMLLKDGLIEPQPYAVVLRLVGSVVLGGVFGPLVFQAMEGLDDTLGLAESESD
ncbi:MAG: rod shape-determining protein MreD [Kiritimatiellae bacterium]|nr:rod shape-determining protein MreD [Kiritimatiellia bacterium]MDW8458198.1 rod shape-determining protein MreD [Verrucomicrobiota bacterium]